MLRFGLTLFCFFLLRVISYFRSVAMKLSVMIFAAFAAVSFAAPAPEPVEAEAAGVEPRGGDNRSVRAGDFNNFNFQSQDLNYLLRMNNLNLEVLQQLSIQNNLNLGGFQSLFSVQGFDLNSLLQFQQLNTLVTIANTGVFNTFDLGALNFGGLNLGVINGINSFNVGSLVEQSLVTQITSVATQGEFRRRGLFPFWNLVAHVLKLVPHGLLFKQAGAPARAGRSRCGLHWQVRRDDRQGLRGQSLQGVRERVWVSMSLHDSSRNIQPSTSISRWNLD